MNIEAHCTLSQCVCDFGADNNSREEKVGEKILIYCRARTMRQQHKNLLIRHSIIYRLQQHVRHDQELFSC